MRRNRLDEEIFSSIADELGVSLTEVRRAVQSFFGIIVSDSRKLPFDNRQKIFTRERFNSFAGSVWNIPYIGRIGPVYSRYLSWRRNESKNFEQERRSNYRKGITQDEIENMAEEILSGRTPSPVSKKQGSELFKRVWLVGQDGKKSARQVIPKKKNECLK